MNVIKSLFRYLINISPSVLLSTKHIKPDSVVPNSPLS